jgi:hypothetical protein
MVMFSLLTNPPLTPTHKVRMEIGASQYGDVFFIDKSPLSLSLQLTKLERKLEPHNMVMFSLLTNPPFLSHSNSQS